MEEKKEITKEELSIEKKLLNLLNELADEYDKTWGENPCSEFEGKYVLDDFLDMGIIEKIIKIFKNKEKNNGDN